MKNCLFVKETTNKLIYIFFYLENYKKNYKKKIKLVREEQIKSNNLYIIVFVTNKFKIK